MRKLFTSESVTEGHPDKVCDRISDAVLDAVLAKDSEGRVACETCCTTDTVFIAGEITSKVDVDIEGIARRVLRDIGYTGGAKADRLPRAGHQRSHYEDRDAEAAHRQYQKAGSA